MSSFESDDIPDWVYQLGRYPQSEEVKEEEESQVFFTPEKKEDQNRGRSYSLDFNTPDEKTPPVTRKRRIRRGKGKLVPVLKHPRVNPENLERYQARRAG